MGGYEPTSRSSVQLFNHCQYACELWRQTCSICGTQDTVIKLLPGMKVRACNLKIKQ